MLASFLIKFGFSVNILDLQQIEQFCRNIDDMQIRQWISSYCAQAKVLSSALPRQQTRLRRETGAAKFESYQRV